MQHWFDCDELACSREICLGEATGAGLVAKPTSRSAYRSARRSLFEASEARARDGAGRGDRRRRRITMHRLDCAIRRKRIAHSRAQTGPYLVRAKDLHAPRNRGQGFACLAHSHRVRDLPAVEFDPVSSPVVCGARCTQASRRFALPQRANLPQPVERGRRIAAARAAFGATGYRIIFAGRKPWIDTRTSDRPTCCEST